MPSLSIKVCRSMIELHNLKSFEYLGYINQETSEAGVGTHSFVPEVYQTIQGLWTFGRAEKGIKLYNYIPPIAR